MGANESKPGVLAVIDEAANANAPNVNYNLLAARAAVAELVDERDRLANIVRSYERSLFRIDRQLRDLVAIARKFDVLYHPDTVGHMSPEERDDRPIFGVNRAFITLGDLRRLRAALAEFPLPPEGK